jgi:hypothetical protein
MMSSKASSPRRAGAGQLARVRRLGEDLVELLERGRGLLEVAHQHGQLRERGERLAQVRGEGDDQSHLDGAAHGLARAIHEDRRDGHRDHELDEREERAPERVRTHHAHLGGLRVVALEVGQVALLLPEGAHDGASVQ